MFKSKNKSTIILILVSIFLIMASLLFIGLIIFAINMDDVTVDSSIINATINSESADDENTIKGSDVTVYNPNTTSSVVSSNITESKPSYYSEPELNSSHIESNNQIDINSSINEAEKQLFKQLYSMAESQYKSEKSLEISNYNTQLQQWQDKSEQYTKQKYKERQILEENFASMGLLQSGQYTSALNNLNNKYDNLLSECRAYINQLSDQISDLEREKQNPDPNKILAIIATNNGMTPAEVLEKYNKYYLNQ